MTSQLRSGIVFGIVMVLLLAMAGPVSAEVSANFTADVLEGPVPLTVQFTDVSSGSPTAWEWSFGDGNLSVLQNPVHTYATSGTFTVSLNVSNASGYNTTVYRDYITVTSGSGVAPTAWFTATPDYGPAPLTVQFYDGSSGASAWNWSFGDGNFSSLQNPVHTYQIAGTFTVSLNASNSAGHGTVTKPAFIIVNSSSGTETPVTPVASFTATPTAGTVPLTVTFSDLSSGSPIAWEWSFGDGNLSVLQNPVHTYATSGTFTVSLNVSNASGYNTTVYRDYITVTSGSGAAPTAWFIATPDYGPAPLTVQFYDGSSGASAWNWSFGDGNFSSLQNPVHLYASEGTFTVVLNASNAYGTASRTGQIIVSPLPLVDFNANTTSGTAPLTVRFMDLTNSTPTAWNWSFGDGNYSTLQNPVHTYQIAGTFTVSLNASNSAGHGTVTKPAFIIVNSSSGTETPVTPVANFTATPASGTVPLTVTFTDLSSGSPTAWNWSFGDGNFSESPNPTHIYASTGSFSVSLDAANAAGHNTLTKGNYIQASGSALPHPMITLISPAFGTRNSTVSYTITGTNFEPGLTTVTFANSTGGLLNTTTLTSVTPTKINGTIQIPNNAVLELYNISVTTVDGGSAWKSSAFKVSKPNPPMITGINNTIIYRNTTTAFTISGSNFVPGLTTVTFVTPSGIPLNTPALTSVTAATIAGTITVPANAATGSYNISVTTVDGGTAWRPSAFIVNPRPKPAVTTFVPSLVYRNTTTAFTITGTNFQPDLTSVAIHNSSFRSIGVLTLTNVSTTRITGTLFVPSDTPVGSYNLNVSTVDGGYTMRVGALMVNKLPAPNIAGMTPKWGYAGRTVDFSLTGNSFQPGLTTVYLSNPPYSSIPATISEMTTTRINGTIVIPSDVQPGLWRANVSTVDGGDRCLAGAFTILSTTSPPIPYFTENITNGIVPLTIQFRDISYGDTTAWNWSFGDGNYSTVQNPVYSYEIPGNYSVSLNATNAYGSNINTQENLILADERFYSYNSQWGTPGSGNGEFNNPLGIAMDSAGNFYVLDSVNYRVQKFSSDGTYLAQWGSSGSSPGQFSWPVDIAVDRSGNVYVLDQGNSTIEKFSSAGTYLTEFGSAGSENGQLSIPCDIAVDDSGNVYVTDNGNSRVQKFSSAGTYLTQWGTGGFDNGQFNNPTGIAADSNGNVYVNDNGNFRVQKFSSAGTYLTQWGTGGSDNGRFSAISGIAVDIGLNVYIADTGNSRVQKFSSTGTYLTQFGSAGPGNGQFINPQGITVDGSGNVYVADSGNNRVQKFVPAYPVFAPVSFNATPLSGLPPLAVGFNDLSTVKSPTKWNWSFGDGQVFSTTSATLKNPTHTYAISGRHSVTLIVTNATSSYSFTKPGYIDVQYPVPTVTEISPQLGSPDGGTVVMINGTGFTPDATVWFGSVNATNVVYLSASRLSATSPSGAGIVDITVATRGGTSALSPADQFTYPGSWVRKTAAAPWESRHRHSSVAMPDGSIVLMGGWGFNGPLNDTWRSADSGATWTQMTPSAGWSVRNQFSSVAMPDGSIVLMGGIGGISLTGTYLSERTNDTWRSTDYGATWTEVNASSGWPARSEFSSVAMPDGSIVLMGGDSSFSGSLNDTWRSTDYGATWTEVNASSGWPARCSHSSVVLPDGSIVLMGGATSNGVLADRMNDIWRSTDYGATWTEVNAGSEWPARSESGSVVLPDGSIVLLGGWNNNGEQNDVWKSVDSGATWTELSADPGWSGRYGHSSVVMPDSSIVLTGGTDRDTAFLNDTWLGIPAISTTPRAYFTGTPVSGTVPLTVQFKDTSYGSPTTWNWSFGDGSVSELQNPAHTYTSAGNYTVSLKMTNAEGSSTREIPEFIHVSLPTADYILTLWPGWNFVSTPRKLVSDNNTAMIFRDVNTSSHTIWQYDAQAKAWKAMMASDTIRPLSGIWIYSDSTVNIPLWFDKNPLSTPPEKQVYAGWNAIGFSDTATLSAKETLNSLGSDWSVVMGYDAGIQGYETTIINGGTGTRSDTRPMLPGKGYWLYMIKDGALAGISA